MYIFVALLLIHHIIVPVFNFRKRDVLNPHTSQTAVRATVTFLAIVSYY